MKRATVEYGDHNNYVVKMDGKLKGQFVSKCDAIFLAQTLNGWPADGDEQSYGRQAKEYDDVQKTKA